MFPNWFIVGYWGPGLEVRSAVPRNDEAALLRLFSREMRTRHFCPYTRAKTKNGHVDVNGLHSCSGEKTWHALHAGGYHY
jgi:hypothetical protein